MIKTLKRSEYMITKVAAIGDCNLFHIKYDTKRKMNLFLFHDKSILGMFLTELWKFYELPTRYREHPNKIMCMSVP
jgi:hypothetical protein